jgi:hypothetical protein
MEIKLHGVFVDDQDKPLKFYAKKAPDVSALEKEYALVPRNR